MRGNTRRIKGGSLKHFSTRGVRRTRPFPMHAAVVAGQSKPVLFVGPGHQRGVFAALPLNLDAVSHHARQAATATASAPRMADQ
jgi:hypothetical protein